MNYPMFAEFLITFISVFALTAVLLRFIIPILKSHKLGQPIKDIGPRWHKSKEGTPVMGGIAFIIAGLFVLLIITAVSWYRGTASELIPLAFGVGLAVANGMIGFFDDYCKLLKKSNDGLRAYQKYALQVVVALAYLLAMQWTGNLPMSLEIPFVDIIIEFEGYMIALYYLIAVILITGIVNSVNLTDGIDGLASSVTFVVGSFFAVLAFVVNYRPLSLLSAVIVGGVLGFLVYNWHPARIFMGDTGSLFLGGAVVGAAFLVKQPLIILIAGFVYVIEAVSDIIQVGVFKLSGRKIRVFKMAPIHHHFEKCGRSEVKIVVVFSIAAAISCIVAYVAI